jgi:hypothetical protein
MNAHQDPLNLSSLPEIDPPADLWPGVESALRRRSYLRKAGRHLASAALIALVVGIYWQMPSQPRPVEQQPPLLTDVQEPMTSPAENTTNNIKALISLSQKLERNLRHIRSEAGPMPNESLIYQVELEDLVAQVDESINQHPQSMELWSQRVNLLLDLEQLYRQQLRRNYANVASL